jgi:hypothetical protein
MAVLLASYDPSGNGSAIDDDGYIGDSTMVLEVSQSFASGDGGTLDSAKFYLSKTGSPTGNAYARIYAHTGTYGTSSLPTGSVLATSDALNVASLTTSRVLTTLSFSGANRISLTASTYYCVTFYYANGSAWSTAALIGKDSSSPSHAGNVGEYRSSWTAANDQDLLFYLYVADAGGVVIPVFMNQYRQRR